MPKLPKTIYIIFSSNPDGSDRRQCGEPYICDRRAIAALKLLTAAETGQRQWWLAELERDESTPPLRAPKGKSHAEAVGEGGGA